MCGSWQSDVSDTVRCAWQWWQQTVLLQQWVATGSCLYCEIILWGCLGPRLRHRLSANNTTQPTQHNKTQHPSYTNSNNQRCRTVPNTTAAVGFTVGVLYQLTVLRKHSHYFIRQISSLTSAHQSVWLWAIGWAGQVSAVNGSERSDKDRHLMKQYRFAHLQIFGAATQYRYSAVNGNV